MTDPVLTLKPGREKSLRQRHPWIFSGSVDRIEDSPTPGSTVTVVSAVGEWLASAAYSPTSNIRARVWSFDQNTEIGRQFILGRLRAAVSSREMMGLQQISDAYRLVHGESDGLPGLVVDRYGEYLVVQILSTGIEHWRNEIISSLAEITNARGIYERSDVDVRRLEGLPERKGLVFGQEPPQRLTIIENGLHFYVNLQNGQKTGFYLDQRQNRQWIQSWMKDRTVLNCFCYTGAFSVYSLAGNAKEVTSIDSASDALSMGRENVDLNNFSNRNVHWVEGDVFQELRWIRDRGQKFDAIILDPPKFAPTIAQAERAARGYKDINLLAFKLLNPGGVLFTFSCSGGISAEFFQKIVASAALDANVDACIIKHFSQDLDHPVALNFQEGSYLKGLALLVKSG